MSSNPRSWPIRADLRRHMGGLDAFPVRGHPPRPAPSATCTLSAPLGKGACQPGDKEDQHLGARAALVVAWLVAPLAAPAGALTGICEGVVYVLCHGGVAMSPRRQVRQLGPRVLAHMHQVLGPVQHPRSHRVDSTRKPLMSSAQAILDALECLLTSALPDQTAFALAAGLPPESTDLHGLRCLTDLVRPCPVSSAMPEVG